VSSTVDSPPSDGLLELVAQRLHAVADPTRLRLLMLLERGHASVQELTDELPTTHQNVSKHLGVMQRVGIITRSKEGRRARYEISDYTTARLVKQAAAGVTGHIEELAHIAGIDESPA
jgi:DNA-binding transcriptional ArsR family regulator